MITEIVPSALAGERLDRVVSLMADISRAVAAQLGADGGVEVDGRPERSGKIRLVEGQVVMVDEGRIPSQGAPVADVGVEFRVVHTDEWVIVVDKPAGLVVHPGAGNTEGTLVNGLLARFPDLAGVGEAHRPGIVHRLDAGSTGLLVVARTATAHEHLVEQFADHSATRQYVALVWGHPEAPHGIIDAPLGRSRRDPLKMAVVADGRPARTEYRVVSRHRAPAECALLECTLETGRTHQIRVHLASIGHPLIGDPWYGQRRPTLGLGRPFLHAARLEFDHPAGTGRAVFESPLAPDLVALTSTLETVPES
ncbi:MAG: RluA family pseudouridine synthase [Ilumatobacteraceae bacterium]